MRKDEMKKIVRITLDPEIDKLLRENDIDLFAMLAKDPAIDGRFSRIAASEFPVPWAGGGERMDPLTIAASATVIVALGSVIERIIKVLTRRPVVLTNEHYEPVLDSEGRPVMDSDGRPALSKTTTQTYEESKDVNAPAWEMRVAASELKIALGKLAA